MPLFRIHHITKYEYDRAVKESVNKIMIYPYHTPMQEVIQHEILITDKPDIDVYTDYWGNRNGAFNLLRPHRELTIESKLVVRTLTENNTRNISLKEMDPFGYNDIHLIELTKSSPLRAVAEMEKYVTALWQPSKTIQDIVEATCHFIFSEFTYIKGITTIESTLDEILEKKAGVCQDFAHVMLELLRRMQIPSRYVSGYICPNKNGMRGEGATHAWVEAYIPGLGWTGIDPTNNAWATNHHVKLAVGRDFTDCTPVKGSFKGPARQSLSVYVSVGYEDGEMFEELNSVQLEKQSAVQTDSLIDTFAGQQ